MVDWHELDQELHSYQVAVPPMPQVQNPSVLTILDRTVTLATADLVALATTPFVLVPAPGAGRLLIPIGFTLIYDFGTHPYQGTGLQDVQYAGAANDSVLPNGITLGGIITEGASSFFFTTAAVAQNPNLAADTNQAIQLPAGTTALGGPIATAALGAPGAGYVANDTGTITTGNGDATYKILTVGAGGAVLTFQITAPGTGYTTGNGQATATGGAQPGAGVGFTVNITAVQNGDGTLKVTTFYAILPVP